MAIEKHTFRGPALSLFSFDPYLSHVLEHHVEEVIETAESTCELALALHDDPYLGADALV